MDRDDVAFQSLDLGGWTGGSVWESGEALARLLVTEGSSRVVGRRVLELGCGTGLVGLAAAAAGAGAVTGRLL